MLFSFDYHVSGTPQVSSFLALAASAAAASALTSVSGDGDGPEGSVGDDTTSSAVSDDHVTPSSAWSPPPDMAEAFMSQVGLDPDAWEESKRLGPSTVAVVHGWTSANFGFRPIRRDPSLHAPFEKFAKDNKPLYDFVLSLLGSSLAVAHASSHAASFVEEFLKTLPMVLEGRYWSQFCVKVEQAFAADVLFPLRDSTHCLAGSVGKAIAAIRAGVFKQADAAVQPVLWSSPPSAGFFFSDPSSQV